MPLIVNVLICTENNITMQTILIVLKIGFIFMLLEWKFTFMRFTHLDWEWIYKKYA